MFHVNMPEGVDEPLRKTLHSGYIGQGPMVEYFEQKFAGQFGFDGALAVNSGTSAITLALVTAGVGAGDEVITTPMTCTATNLPILTLGATPIFADIDPVTGLIDPDDIEDRITVRTKAIMAVDWGGQPVDVEALMYIAQRHGLELIVDAAHALGAIHNEQPDFLCYSFQAIKHLTTGDGGMLVCLSEADHERAKRLRWFGIGRTGTDSRVDQDITEPGYKFHMNDIAATIGLAGLETIQSVLLNHRVNADYFADNLSDYYLRPKYDPACSYWLYTILLPNERERDRFLKTMPQFGVEVSRVHRRNDDYTVFEPYRRSLPGVDKFSSRMVCIPVHSDLSLFDLHAITDACNAFAEAK